MRRKRPKWRARRGLRYTRPLKINSKISGGSKGFKESSRMLGRVLAIDIGTKRVGVAVSDELRITARPLPALKRTSWKHLVKHLATLCEAFDVKKVVLGLPLRLDGSVGDAALEAKRLAGNLSLSLRLPVALQDERYTSKTAEAKLRDEGVRDESIPDLVDSESAVIILSDFLLRQGDDAES